MTNRHICSLLSRVSALVAVPFYFAACSSSSEEGSEPIDDTGGETATGAVGTTGSMGPTGTSVTSNSMTNSGSTLAATTNVATASMSSASASTTTGSVSSTGGGSNTTTGDTGTGGGSGGSTMSTTDSVETTGTTSGGSDGPAPTESNPSAGCQAPASAAPCDTSGSPCTMDVDGTQREFYVVLPDDYDPTRPYPVVFQFHPLGGTAEQGMNMYGVRPNFPDAIYVTPQGLISLGNNPGFANENGRDEAMTRAIMADIEAKYCVDRARYFSTGFSYGGSMSYTAACNMSDVFRAVAAMAGAPISGARCENESPANRVAVWGSHGSMDTALPVEMALPIRDAFVERNGCGAETIPVEPSPCVEYQGCDDGYPVVWCLVEGQGHAIPEYGPAAIAEFFQVF